MAKRKENNRRAKVHKGRGTRGKHGRVSQQVLTPDDTSASSSSGDEESASWPHRQRRANNPGAPREGDEIRTVLRQMGVLVQTVEQMAEEIKKMKGGMETMQEGMETMQEGMETMQEGMETRITECTKEMKEEFTQRIIPLVSTKYDCRTTTAATTNHFFC